MDTIHQKDQALRLLQFLQEYVKLNTKVIYDLSSYEQEGAVVWFHQLPQLQDCVTPLWSENLDDDVWLEFKKPMLEPQPEPKLGLKLWLIQSSRFAEPKIKSKIKLPNPAFKEDDTQPEFIEVLLENKPDIQATWEIYLLEWRKWNVRNEKKIKTLSIYSKLYQVYQKHKQNQEILELVLAIGFAQWQPSTGAKCRRHLITTKIDLQFDSARGVLSIKVPEAIDTNVLLLEDEFLPVKLSLNEQVRLKEFLLELNTALFNKDAVKVVLNGIANTLDSKSSLTMDIETEHVYGNHLHLSYAPAIILRKRAYRGILLAYKQILEEVGKSVTVPKGLARIIEPELSSLQFSNQANSSAKVNDRDDILYFPKPANEEQIKIARRLEYNQGVLVQGPPGTGKSHTISNLVSHLLAKGKRVLVTSETTRALAVLKDKIPAEVSALCVNLLGEDSKSFNELETSINGITQKHASYDLETYQKEIEKLQKEIAATKERQASINKRLLELRYAEIDTITINAHYKGTASAIARQVNNARELFEWLNAKEESSFSKAEAQKLLNNLKRLGGLDSDLLNQNLPDFDQLISFEEFKNYIQAEQHAKELDSQLAKARNNESYMAFSFLNHEDFKPIEQKVKNFQTGLQRIRQTKDGWVTTALQDCFQGKAQIWQILSANLEKLLNKTDILNQAHWFDGLKLDYPESVSEKQILTDAKIVREHLKQKKPWTNLFGMPVGAAKGRTYLKTDVSLNGSLASDTQTLKQIIMYLEFKKDVDDIWQYWSPYIKFGQMPYELQIAKFQELHEVLATLFELRSEAQEMEAFLSQLTPPIYFDITPETVAGLSSYLQALSAEKALKEQENIFITLRKQLELLEKPHPVCQKLIQALDTRNTETWLDAQNELADLLRRKAKALETSKLFEQFSRYAPDTAQLFQNSFREHVWEERFANFDEARAWQEANLWLSHYDDKNLQRSLAVELEELSKKLGQKTAEIAATKAWLHFLSRLTPKQSQSLAAWKAAVKKIGKGTGKNAAHYRKIAQEHMAVCIPAIPAWIMPRYRLPEIMNMAENLFDVIIVDEASQTGIDGLFLHHIGKSLVIVGDDQQISPSYIGIKEEDVMELQSKYLYDVHLSGLIGPATNLYSLAQILFDSQSKVVLQEHFRCMPEIIRFSDGLCYLAKGTPLIPLRNYPPNRLEPLKKVYVDSGYQEGSSSNASNLPEARALVEAINTCISDSVYEGKTMGVISLLGSRQAEIIGQMLVDSIGEEEIEKRQIVWGDAYSFQGDERDIMFLSLVSAPSKDAKVSALTADQYVQRYNVATSRAKDQLWLFHSAKLEHLSSNPSCVRRKLVSFFYDDRNILLESQNVNIDELLRKSQLAQYRGDSPVPFDSWFEVDVFLELYNRGYRIVPQFKVANFRIDLVVEGSKGRLAIECDGDRWHGQEQYQADISRQRQLERAGWEFFRVRGSAFYANPTKALLPLWDELKRREIYPYQEIVQNHDDALSVQEPRASNQGNFTSTQITKQTNVSLDEISSAIDDLFQTDSYITPRTVKAMLDWANLQPKLPAKVKAFLSAMNYKIAEQDLSDNEEEALTKLYDFAQQHGFRPPHLN